MEDRAAHIETFQPIVNKSALAPLDERQDCSLYESRLDPFHDERQDNNVRADVEGGREDAEGKTGFSLNLWSWIDPTYNPEEKYIPPSKPKLDPPTQQKPSLDIQHVNETDWTKSAWNTLISWIDPEVSVPEPNTPCSLPEMQQDGLNSVDCPSEDSTEKDGSNLLGPNIKSLPSLTGDEDQVADESLVSVDMLKSDDGKNAASVVETTLKNFTMNVARLSPTASVHTAEASVSGAPAIDSIAARSAEFKMGEAPKIPMSEASKKTEDNRTVSITSKSYKTGDSTDTRRSLLVKELRHAVETFGRYDIRCANISAALADILQESGQLEQAIKLHKDAVTIYGCKLGDDHTTTTNAKVRLGAVLENAGLYDEAINMYYMATSMRRSLLGENDPTVADGYVLMAQALRKKGEFMQAIKELKRALKIYRESLGDAHEKVSHTVDEIASLYVTIGDFDKSAAILEEVVKLKAATLGPSHTAVAATLCTLATTYECSSQFEKAMKSLKKAYKIYTDIGGYSSEDSTNVLNRMAQLYEVMDDYNRAAIAYLGVLRGRKVNHGSNNLLVGETYYKLGRVLRQTEQHDKALKCMKEALPIFVGKATEMTDAGMIADIMHEMALANKDKGNHADAARIFKQELSVRRKMGQPEFPVIARTLNHVGVAEYQLSNNTRALKYLVEALNIFQRQGEETVDCGEVLYNTGLVFEAVRNNERALEAFTESARIFQDQGYDKSHPHLSKANYKIEKLQRRKNDDNGSKSMPRSRSEGKKDGSVMKRLFK